jgi:hypothetical protein
LALAVAGIHWEPCDEAPKFVGRSNRQAGAPAVTALNLSRLVLSTCAAITLLQGYGASPVSIGAVTPAQAATFATRAGREGSREPRRSKVAPFLFAFGVTEFNNDYIYVVSWPRGLILHEIGPIFTIRGICTDHAGNVFVLSWGDKGYIREYAHAGTLVQTLHQAQRFPTGCAVDPTTGNLAVTSLDTLTIFKGGKGRPTRYTDPGFAVFDFDAYDDHGNLFVDGRARNNVPLFAVLPKGAKSFTKVHLDKQIERPTTLQWVGGELAVSTEYGHEIYQVQVSGSHGSVAGSTSLGECGPIDTFIFEGKAISNCGELVVFKYPAGAPPIKTYMWLGAQEGLVGLVISE